MRKRNFLFGGDEVNEGGQCWFRLGQTGGISDGIWTVGALKGVQVGKCLGLKRGGQAAVLTKRPPRWDSRKNGIKFEKK